MLNLSKLTLKLLLASATATTAVLAMDPAGTTEPKKGLWGRLFGAETSRGLTPLLDPVVTGYCTREAHLGRAEVMRNAALEAMTCDDHERLGRISACLDRHTVGYMNCQMRNAVLERFSKTATAQIDRALRTEFTSTEKGLAKLIQTPEFSQCVTELSRPTKSSSPSCSI